MLALQLKGCIRAKVVKFINGRTRYVCYNGLACITITIENEYYADARERVSTWLKPVVMELRQPDIAMQLRQDEQLNLQLLFPKSIFSFNSWRP